MKRIKCISLWQPWAALIFVPDPEWRKEHETRSWAPPKGIDGFVIHAAKRFTREQQELTAEQPFQHAIELLGKTLHFGAYLGYVDLVAVHKADDARQLVAERPDFDFGNFSAGRFAWQLANPRKFVQPIIGRGNQGIWDPPAEVLERLQSLGIA